MRILTVRHRTTYTYDRPVTFGEHMLMVRPRDSHEFHLLESGLRLEPTGQVRWLFDIFGNSIARVEFQSGADRLDIESRITLEHHGIDLPDFQMVEDYAQRVPFCYPAEAVGDLARTHERHYSDPTHAVDAWARQYLGPDGTADTVELLMAMNRGVSNDFTYVRREEHGTQTPVQTLEKGVGSCRDFALLFIEAVRSLGFAARFVTGYLYDSAVDQPSEAAVRGAGATHAWASVYLPGAGWVDFDPTNGLAGGQNLITVATARDPSQAIPVSGTYFGPAEAFSAMQVEVEVTQSPARTAEPAV